MKTAIVISDSLSLPIDAVTQKFGILGRTGSGKTYAANKLAEENGYSSNSGGFNNSLSRLRTLELIGRGQPIAISSNFFG